MTTILLVAALVAGGIYGLTQYQREAGFRPLYTTLAPEDAALVVQQLKESGSRLSSFDERHDGFRSRRQSRRAAPGYWPAPALPKSGRIGFEIFDKTNFGMTDFAEHVNYRRALEGELERSVMAMSEVEQARVHISFPEGIGVSGIPATRQGQRADEHPWRHRNCPKPPFPRSRI